MLDRLLWLVVAWWRTVGVGGLSDKVPVDHEGKDEPDNAHHDDRLEVLEPELVLQGGGPLLELGAAILQSVSSLLQGVQLGVPLKPGKIRGCVIRGKTDPCSGRPVILMPTILYILTLARRLSASSR